LRYYLSAYKTSEVLVNPIGAAEMSSIKSVLLFFFCFFTKMSLNRSDISTGDRAHQFVPPRISGNFDP